MSEPTEECRVVSIATSHRVAVCQPWSESEQGWVTPHSYSLHTSLGDAWVFIRGIYKPREQELTTPSSYIRVEGAPYPTVVTDRLYREIGVTRPSAPPQSNKRYEGHSGLVRPVLEVSQYPGDCRNEDGDFPPAFRDEEVLMDWESHFRLFCFDQQEATSRFFNRVFANLARPLD